MIKLLITLFFILLPTILLLISPLYFISYILFSGGISTKIFLGTNTEINIFGSLSINALIILIQGSILWLLVAFNIRKLTTIFYILIPNLFFLTYCILTTFWSPNWIYALRMIAKLAIPFLMFLAVYVVIKTDKDFKLVEKSIILGSSLILLIALINNLFDLDHSKWVLKNILTSPFSSPAPFSFNLGAGALFSLYMYFKYRNNYYLFLNIIFGLGIIWAFTRISMVAYILSSSILLFFSLRSTLLKIFLPLLMLTSFVVFILFNATYNVRFFGKKTSFDYEDVFYYKNIEKKISSIPTSGRKELWKLAIKKFLKKNPIQGAGIGATQNWFYEKNKKKSGAVLHSEYLRIICETGIIGLTLFLFMLLFYIIWLLFLIIKKSDAKENAILALSLLLFYMITMLTDNSLDYISQIGNYVFTAIALTSAKLKLRDSKQGFLKKQIVY